MREIKFRAWERESKVMFEPHGLIFVPGIASKETPGLGIDVNPASKDYVVMQYTGLKDKNGKEIYEGDVVLRADGEQCSIVYKDNWAGFAFERKSTIGKHYSPMAILNHPEYYALEVIGNIWENPELVSPPPTGEKKIWKDSNL